MDTYKEKLEKRRSEKGKITLADYKDYAWLGLFEFWILQRPNEWLEIRDIIAIGQNDPDILSYIYYGENERAQCISFGKNIRHYTKRTFGLPDGEQIYIRKRRTNERTLYMLFTIGRFKMAETRLAR